MKIVFFTLAIYQISILLAIQITINKDIYNKNQLHSFAFLKTEQPQHENLVLCVYIGNNYSRITTFIDDKVIFIKNKYGEINIPLMVTFLNDNLVLIGKSSELFYNKHQGINNTVKNFMTFVERSNFDNYKNLQSDLISNDILKKRINISNYKIIEEENDDINKMFKTAYKVQIATTIKDSYNIAVKDVQNLTFDEVLSLYLKGLIQISKSYVVGKSFKKLIFIVPNSFSFLEKQTLLLASKIAGIEVVDFVNNNFARVMNLNYYDFLSNNDAFTNRNNFYSNFIGIIDLNDSLQVNLYDYTSSKNNPISIYSFASPYNSEEILIDFIFEYIKNSIYATKGILIDSNFFLKSQVRNYSEYIFKKNFLGINLEKLLYSLNHNNPFKQIENDLISSLTTILPLSKFINTNFFVNLAPEEILDNIDEIDINLGESLIRYIISQSLLKMRINFNHINEQIKEILSYNYINKKIRIFAYGILFKSNIIKEVITSSFDLQLFQIEFISNECDINLSNIKKCSFNYIGNYNVSKATKSFILNENSATTKNLESYYYNRPRINNSNLILKINKNSQAPDNNPQNELVTLLKEEIISNNIEFNSINKIIIERLVKANENETFSLLIIENKYNISSYLNEYYENILLNILISKVPMLLELKIEIQIILKWKSNLEYIIKFLNCNVCEFKCIFGLCKNFDLENVNSKITNKIIIEEVNINSSTFISTSNSDQIISIKEIESSQIINDVYNKKVENLLDF